MPPILVPDPIDYVPYVARQLEVSDDEQVLSKVKELLETVDVQGGTNPMSEVGAAFYVVLKRSFEYNHTQQAVANAVDLSTVTIRNNYEKYADVV